MLFPMRRSSYGTRERIPPPVSAPPSSSHTTARPDPLCSPNGRSAPFGASRSAPGSVAGRPSASMMDPSRTWSPRARASRTLPSATRLVAKSRSTATDPPGPGMPTQNGFVMRRRSRPWKGATSGAWPTTFTKWIETRPPRAACSAYAPTRPTWNAFRSGTAASPTDAARAIPAAIASRATSWPNPRPPSAARIGPPRSSRIACARGCSRPAAMARTYCGSIPMPWLSWPARFASTRWSTTITASRSSAPAATSTRLPIARSRSWETIVGMLEPSSRLGRESTRPGARRATCARAPRRRGRRRRADRPRTGAGRAARGSRRSCRGGTARSRSAPGPRGPRAAAPP